MNDTTTAHLPIEAKLDITLGERLRASWMMVRAMPTALALLSIFPALGIVILVLNLSSGSHTTFWAWCMTLAAFAYSPCVFFIGAWQRQRAMAKWAPHVYRFDADGLEVKSSKSEFRQPWSAIPRARQHGGILYFYMTKNLAHIVPVRTLGGPSHAEAVMQLAKAGGVGRVDHDDPGRSLP